MEPLSEGQEFSINPEMPISFKPLFHLLLDRDIRKKDLAEMTGISTTVISKMGRGEHVTTETLARICEALDCKISDIVEYVPEESPDKPAQ